MANHGGLIRQAGVIPMREGQICLVSSRSGKRWVVPKGSIDAGRSAAEVALVEAWEEAGLVGLLQHEPLGSYVYEKDGMTCHVIIFLMTTTGTVDHYPEAGMRQRVWLSPSQALGWIEDTGLRDILRAWTIARAG